MTQQIIITSNEHAVILAANLIQIAECSGLEIIITIPPKNKETPRTAKGCANQKARSWLNHKRKDFAWLQTHITQHPNGLARLSNQYVAVYDQRIVSIGCSKELVSIVAAASLHVSPDHLLVVPVPVIGTESEDEWLQVKQELGIV